MTKKQRRIIFYICFFIFIILAPIIILYSIGWRIDFKNFKLLPSGALYLKTNQSGIKVYLDNKFKKESNNLPFFNTIFIKNLASRSYNIKIKKDNYWPWEKTLKIEPELVTEVENIILIPKNPTPEPISSNILKKNFIISKNNKNIYWLSPITNNTEIKSSLELNSFNLEGSFLNLIPPTSTKEIIFPNQSQKIIKTINLVDISWDSNNFLFKTDNNIWFLYDNKKDKLTNLNKILEKILPKLINLEFYPHKNSLLIFTFNNLYEMKLEDHKVSFPKLTNILYYKTFQDYIYFIDNKFNLSKINIYNDKIENIVSLKELIKTKMPVFNLEMSSVNLVLNINSFLYLINEKDKTIKPIGDGVILAKFSNDDKKLALITKNNDLFVYYLENITEKQPRKFANQMDKIIHLNETPLNIFWHQKNEHIFLQSDNQLIFTEIDNRDKVNYYSIINKRIEKSYFNPSDNYIYLNIDSGIIRIKIK